ncbi:MAG: TIGR00269 family protein [Promethearchaeota archaeon]
MNKTARDLGYDVLTTGHNLDDEVSVLFGNIINWNIEFLKKQYPVLREGDGFVRKVKPLCKMSEEENRIYCEFNEIIYFKEPCPYSKQATSLKYNALLDQLESEFAGKKLDFYSNFLKKMHPLLNQRIQKKEVGSCEICGEPCFSNKCSICYIREKLDKSYSV